MDPKSLICIAVLAFQFAFLLRIVMSFFPIESGSVAASVRDVAMAVTEPVVVPLRRALPPLPGVLAGFGVAEIIVLISLALLVRVICGA